MARQMGYALSKAETDIVLEEIKRLGDAKKSLRRDELADLIDRILSRKELTATQA
jgi:methanogen homocitrate synthase